MKGDMDMKEKNRAEEWFRAKHDELAGTARANLAAHDLEPGQEAYHLDSLHYATAEQMEAICPTGIDFDRYATLANGSMVGRTGASHVGRGRRHSRRRPLLDKRRRLKRHRRSRPRDAPGPMPPA